MDDATIEIGCYRGPNDAEVAIHLAVRDERGCLLEAPDVGDNVIFVSERLPPSALEAIRAALGSNLRPD
jgi:hypothetical protein